MASIVVVGGGVAGLTCAWRLVRAGHDVEVLESEATAGGRMRSEREGDYLLERGARLVTSGYRGFHGVAGLLGLEGAIQPLAGSGNAVFHNGRFEDADWADSRRILRSPLLSLGAKLRLGRLAVELLRHRDVLDPLRPERAAGLDVEDAAGYLARIAGVEARDEWIGPMLSATFDSDIESLSSAFVLLVLRLALGDSQLQAMHGGLGRFTAALAREVSVRTDCLVSSVETETDGARVRYRVGGREGREGSVVADAAVVAVPGTAVAELCPKLTPRERGFFEGMRYTRGIVAHLLLDEAPAALTHCGVAFPRRPGSDLYGLAAEHCKGGAAPPGAGLLRATLSEAATSRVWGAADGEVAGLVLDNLSRTPLGSLSPRKVVVHRWPAMLPHFAPGHLQGLTGFLGRADRSARLAFCGDYLVGPYVEGALTSGMRAASEVVRSLSDDPHQGL
ncbi:MAG: FAD-dependent oxidoreductase [Deltaproteobacteria bacterium]|nr:FAD-dependent oxidoreductase [Deltaproteobacteria bacterium]MBW2418928.1 FAD-dependent oxidoreductase [Deltaproteobacteria bacterium]